MGTMSAPAVRGRRGEFPRVFKTGLKQLDRIIGTFESPLAQLAVIILAAAMASVLGTAFIKAVAGTIASS